jgi:hypothetical protein
MSVVDDVDVVIGKALDGKRSGISAADHADIAAPNEGPCSREEAQQLIAQAIQAADTFQTVMMELFSRKAHVALGYSTPREMLLSEFKDTIINPGTGRPYSDSHLHRMARVAWLAWAIAERTGVDMTELRIPERPLREISSGYGGSKDRDLVDEIERRVADVAADQDAAPDLVDSIINDVLNEASGRAPRPERDPDSIPPSAPDGDFDSIQGEGEFGGRSASTRTSKSVGDDHGDFDDDGGDGDGAGAVAAFTGADRNAGEPALPPLPPAGATSGLNMSAALKSLRESGDFTRTLQEVISIGERLPNVIDVEAKLPEFLDAIDDSELQSFKALLERGRTLIEFAESATMAIDKIIEETDNRLDEAL